MARSMNSVPKIDPQYTLRESMYTTIRELGPKIPYYRRNYGSQFPNGCICGPSGTIIRIMKLISGNPLNDASALRRIDRLIFWILRLCEHHLGA